VPEHVVQRREDILQLETLLEELGLPGTEARAYLCLLGQSPLSATTIADLTGISRSSVYLVLRSLVDKGLIDAGVGYSSRYSAAPPQQALAGLLERERAELQSRERRLEQALPRLTELFEQSSGVTGEIVEVLRTPRLVGERFDRLQADARHTVEVVVRGPVQVGGANEAEVAALRRGVRARAIYDRGVLDDPSVVRHLGSWISEGEQARVYPGELPMKFALFDSHIVMMPLVAPGVTGVVAIIVRNHQLAAALGMLFNTLWDSAVPLEPELVIAAEAASV
jgi:HTH-type transcriptional regulator, sugar sensing transcriptional regulator